MNIKEIKGFRYAAIAGEVKKAGTDRLDIGLILADSPCVTAGVTTTNKVFAAPVEITRSRLDKGLCQAVLVNSGNANAYTGDEGKRDAMELVNAVAGPLGIDSDLIIPMSTGVIGFRMPLGRMLPKAPSLAERIDGNAFMDVARAIMTTDTQPKVVYLEAELSSGKLQMAGMAKGAGMIAPDMATMLAVITTNCKPDLAFLREAVAEANSVSFNCITVDGDTSTNDTLVVMAGPTPDGPVLRNQSDMSVFRSVLADACKSLAKQIVMDGEGASKLVRVRIVGAKSNPDAARVARKIAESPLVKTAFHGEDPNWGRIVCSAGMAGVELDPARIDLSIGSVKIVEKGKVHGSDWEAAAHKVMTEREFTVTVDLNLGAGEAEMLTTDMSEEYIKINADYRS
jgi:glutamate N-acetyltransferase / amino-acid N-acetyltransferase